jgi:hypothetical protein
VTGPDKDKFYTSIGEKKFTVVEGIIDFAVKKTDAPTEQKPLELTVIAKAPGYLRTIKTFRLTTDTTSYQILSMVNLASPPEGVSVKTGSVTVGAGGATATSLATAGAEPIKVEVPAGTEFKDKDGNVLTGTAEVSLVAFDNHSETSLASFPGGLSVGKARDLSGNELGAGEFSTMGFLALDMTIGGKEVKKFSGSGITLTMDLKEGSINPETGNPVALGDTIPVWSLDETTNAWTLEVKGVVTGTAQNMKLTYQQNHLSWWNLDYWMNICGTGALQTFANVTYPGTYSVQLWNATTNQIMKNLGNIYVANGQKIGFQRAPQGQKGLLKLLPTPYYCVGTVSGTSAQFNFCGANNTLSFNMVAPPAAQSIVVRATAQGNCANRPNFAIYPTVAVMYKEVSACGFWQPAGTMVNGVFQSGVFKAGKQYDVMVVVAGQSAIQRVAIPTQVPGGVYAVDIRVTLPTAVCARL